MMMANSQESMKAIHLIYPPDDDDVHVDEFDAGSRMLSRLSIKSCNDADADADTESTEEEKRGTKISKIKKGLAASLPGTPDRLARRVGWDKEYASESEGRSGGRRRKGWRLRDRWVEKEWERRRRRSGEGGAEGGACRLVVRPMGPDSTCICMDMMEVKACRDLGLDIPRDWTVEMPGGGSAVDSSSGSNSPIANWTVSSPGDDPNEIKARLKVWAQAVALASASQLSG